MRCDLGALAPLVLVAACGGDDPRCEVVGATAEPTVFELNDDEQALVVVAETEACVQDDRVRVDAILNESRQILIGTLSDDGRDTDTVAGDGVYERTMGNPFYGDPDQVGEGVLRFRPCDPECREPAVEVGIRVNEPP